ncbi:hypothetical protein ASG85_31435 [Paenibacillus sp. Soil724D2]|nr:hypothetical protein ASG85_31435 [Paenibacillus sp. Soil724D2]
MAPFLLFQNSLEFVVHDSEFDDLLQNSLEKIFWRNLTLWIHIQRIHLKEKFLALWLLNTLST